MKSEHFQLTGVTTGAQNLSAPREIVTATVLDRYQYIPAAINDSDTFRGGLGGCSKASLLGRLLGCSACAMKPYFGGWRLGQG